MCTYSLLKEEGKPVKEAVFSIIHLINHSTWCEYIYYHSTVMYLMFSCSQHYVNNVVWTWFCIAIHVQCTKYWKISLSVVCIGTIDSDISQYIVYHNIYV